MATHHASVGEVVDLKTWANDLPEQASKVIAKTDEVELARLVFKAGEFFPENVLPGPVILHCLAGNIEINVKGTGQVLSPGQLSYVLSLEPDSVKVVSDSVILMTIVFTNNRH